MDTISREANERKARSETVLRSEGIHLNSHLPIIETTTGVRLRSKEEVAYRTLALLAVALKGEGLEPPLLEKIVKDYGLASYFTLKESVFIKSAAAPEFERTQFTWRYESAWVLFWALGYVEKLGKPSSICDVPMAVTIMKEHRTPQFIADAKLRSLTEVLDEADLIYRYHWAVVDARVNSKPSPAGLDPGVVYERHYTLNWLIGYMGQEWDDITTDT